MKTNDVAIKKNPQKQPADVVKLPISGVTVEIFEGRGKDVMKASRQADGDDGKLTPILMSMLCTINGENWVPEDFGELRAKDYMFLIAKFSAINFYTEE